MKPLIALLIPTLCWSLWAQGTIDFANHDVLRAVNAPVYESDGVTTLSGSQFIAELLVGSSASSLMSIATTGFLTGNAAGYFDGGPLTINGISPGSTAWVEARVWNTASGSSFLQAQASGLPNSWWQSSVFSVVTGNVQTGAGPTPPAALTGLGTSPVYLNGVPEPSTLGLFGLGIAAVVIGSKKRYKADVGSGSKQSFCTAYSERKGKGKGSVPHNRRLVSLSK